MSKFEAMRQQRAAKPVTEQDTTAPTAPIGESKIEPPPSKPSTRTPGREGKKMVGAYYSPAVSRALKTLAAEQGTDLQTVLGEAIDDLMVKHGKHTLGLTSGRN